MSPYLTYYLYLYCHPTLKEDKLLEKLGFPFPRGFYEDLYRISPCISHSKRRGYHEGTTFARVAGLRKKSDIITF